MSSSHPHRYVGPLKAVVLDWAGTTVDHGCMAPVATFMKAFEDAGVPITVEEARAPMGMAKWKHIQAIIQTEAVKGPVAGGILAPAWRRRRGPAVPALPAVARADRGGLLRGDRRRRRHGRCPAGAGLGDRLDDRLPTARSWTSSSVLPRSKATKPTSRSVPVTRPTAGRAVHGSRGAGEALPQPGGVGRQDR